MTGVLSPPTPPGPEGVGNADEVAVVVPIAGGAGVGTGGP